MSNKGGIAVRNYLPQLQGLSGSLVDLTKISEEDDHRFGPITLLKIPDSEAVIFYKQKQASDLEDHNRDILQAKERLKLNDPHILAMLDYTVDEGRSDGQKVYFVRGFYEYPNGDLMKEITMRRSIKKPFTSEYLFMLLADLACSGAFLQRQRMLHGDIRPKYITYNNALKKFQLMDRLGDPAPPHQTQQNNYITATDLYMSPVMYQNFCQNITKFKHNPYKSEAFSVGMVVLEAGLLACLRHLYDVSGFDKAALDACLKELELKYGKDGTKLVETLRKILTVEEAQRMDFLEINEFIKRSKLLAGIQRQASLEQSTKNYSRGTIENRDSTVQLSTSQLRTESAKQQPIERNPMHAATPHDLERETNTEGIDEGEEILIPQIPPQRIQQQRILQREEEELSFPPIQPKRIQQQRVNHRDEDVAASNAHHLQRPAASSQLYRPDNSAQSMSVQQQPTHSRSRSRAEASHQQEKDTANEYHEEAPINARVHRMGHDGCFVDGSGGDPNHQYQGNPNHIQAFNTQQYAGAYDQSYGNDQLADNNRSYNQSPAYDAHESFQAGRRSAYSSPHGNNHLDAAEEVPINSKVHYSGVDGNCSTSPHRDHQPTDSYGYQEPAHMAPRGVVSQAQHSNTYNEHYEETPINAKVHYSGVDGNCSTIQNQNYQQIGSMTYKQSAPSKMNQKSVAPKSKATPNQHAGNFEDQTEEVPINSKVHYAGVDGTCSTALHRDHQPTDSYGYQEPAHMAPRGVVSQAQNSNTYNEHYEETPINAKVHYSGVDGNCSTSPHRDHQPTDSYGYQESAHMAPRGVVSQAQHSNTYNEQHEEMPINAKVHYAGVDGTCGTDYQQGYNQQHIAYGHNYGFAGGDEQYEYEVKTEPLEKASATHIKPKAIALKSPATKPEESPTPPPEPQDPQSSHQFAKPSRASLDQVGKEERVIKDTVSGRNSVHRATDLHSKKSVDGILKNTAANQYQPEDSGTFAVSVAKEPSVKNVRIVEDPERARKSVDVVPRRESERPGVSSKIEASGKSSQLADSRRPDFDDSVQTGQPITQQDNRTTSRRSSPPISEAPKYSAKTDPPAPAGRISERAQSTEKKTGVFTETVTTTPGRAAGIAAVDRPDRSSVSARREAAMSTSDLQREERGTSPLKQPVERREAGVSTHPPAEAYPLPAQRSQQPQTQATGTSTSVRGAHSRQHSTDRREDWPQPALDQPRPASRAASTRDNQSDLRDPKRDGSNVARAESFRGRPQPLEPVQPRREGSVVALAPTEARAGSPVPSATSDYRRFAGDERAQAGNPGSALKGPKPQSPKSALHRHKPEFGSLQRRSEEPRKDPDFGTGWQQAGGWTDSPSKQATQPARREEEKMDQHPWADLPQASPTGVSKENRASSPIRVISSSDLEQRAAVSQRPQASVVPQQPLDPGQPLPKLSPTDIHFKPSPDPRISAQPPVSRVPAFAPADWNGGAVALGRRGRPSEIFELDGVEFRLGPDGRPEKIIIYGFPSHSDKSIERLRANSRPANIDQHFARDAFGAGAPFSNSTATLPSLQTAHFPSQHLPAPLSSRPQIVQALSTSSFTQPQASLLRGSRQGQASRTFRDSAHMKPKPLLPTFASTGFSAVGDGRTGPLPTQLFQSSQPLLHNSLRYSPQQPQK